MAKIPVPTEYAEQVRIFAWAAVNENRLPDLFLLNGSIMGGSKMSYRGLNKLRKAGMKKGKPDINLPIARGGYIGLWIELKRQGGPNPAEAQVIWLRRLAGAGHLAVCCKGADAAISVIEKYLNGKLIKGQPICDN
jgi:hypothetical protein